MRKPYEYFGPSTWAIIREQYLSGASARTLSIRYGPTVDAIRARISREGWGKIAHAEAIENQLHGPLPLETVPPSHPATQSGVIPHHIPHPAGGGSANPESVAPMHASLPHPSEKAPRTPAEIAHAASLACGRAIAAGRAAEAAALMRTAKELVALCEDIGPFMTVDEFEEEAVMDAVVWPTFHIIMQGVGDVVTELFQSEPDHECVHARALFRYRRDVMGPEVAARDLERARAQGWWRKVWDADGVVTEPEPTLAFRAAFQPVDVASGEAAG